jgi:hypothetical protein
MKYIAFTIGIIKGIARQPYHAQQAVARTSRQGKIILGLLLLFVILAALAPPPDPKHQAEEEAKARVQHLQYLCEDLRDKAIGSLSHNDLQTLRYTCPAFE